MAYTVTINQQASPVRDFVTGDFNGDGKQDYVAVGYGSQNVSYTTLMLGKGDGTFEAGVAIGGTGAVNETGILIDKPTAIAAGDLNGDGKLDFAIVNDTGKVYVLLQNANAAGQFAPRDFGGRSYFELDTPSESARDIAIGNVVGDATVDLIVSSRNNGILAFDGDVIAAGTTTNSQVTYGPGFPTALAIADTGGNGILGVVSGTGTVGGRLDTGVAVGKFNADNRDDIVYSSTDNSGQTPVHSLLVTLSGGATSTLLTSNDRFVDVAVGDLNGDGKVDIAALQYFLASDANTSRSHTLIFTGKGDGTFNAPVSLPPQSGALGTANPVKIAISDLNGGDRDVLVAQSMLGQNGGFDSGYVSVFASAPSAPVYAIATSATSLVEGTPPAAGNSATVTITRTGDVSAAGSVKLFVGGVASPNDDYTLTSPAFDVQTQRVSFAAGVSSATLTVTTKPDSTVEANEQLSLIISDAQNATTSYGSISIQSSVAITITNDDTANSGGGSSGGGSSGGGSSGGASGGGSSGGTTTPGTFIQNNDQLATAVVGFVKDAAILKELIKVLDSGQITKAMFVEQLIKLAANTTVPSLIASSLLLGTTPTEKHLSELAVFASGQLDAYTAKGVAKPAMGPYEALGLGVSEEASFKAKYEKLDDAAFLSKAYLDVFGRAGTTQQLDHFNKQVLYFETLYQANGQSVAQADLHAKGAVIGQMIGHAVLDEPDLHRFDDSATNFLRSAAMGQAKYGDPLALL